MHTLLIGLAMVFTLSAALASESDAGPFDNAEVKAARAALAKAQDEQRVAASKTEQQLRALDAAIAKAQEKRLEKIRLDPIANADLSEKQRAVPGMAGKLEAINRALGEAAAARKDGKSITPIIIKLPDEYLNLLLEVRK